MFGITKEITITIELNDLCMYIIIPLSIGRTFPNVVTELYEVYIHSHSGINTCFWMRGGGLTLLIMILKILS